jgi:hypothetical protein
VQTVAAEMTSTTSRRSLSISSWLLVILVLLLAGAAAAVWTLAHNEGVARFFGVEPQAAQPSPVMLRTTPSAPAWSPPDAQRLAETEARVARLENATRQAAGSAGRADALLIAFAARRAIDRSVALGYLEPLLLDRFGQSHRRAVATIVTGSRSPVSLEQLSGEFEGLGPALQGGGPEESLWDGIKRELGSLVSIRRGDRPSPRPSATYDRARARLADGQVDRALAEAMRLPGIRRAGPWVDKARTYIAVQRALDEIESAALLGGSH